ncbi:zinc phosphodiesterase, putative [Entamoeba invadens IP1]|uniref:Zinc phosphodiesterase, putative n=1 Tax=Entamoeba invadens IP1 TaxID=370355 RepID=A0A0A1TYS3_ENTIV|nr:zinc phosphodiesterase, putative [Entamoeba invadens IP1]ELP83681.1 zinc phosphodiesterase, putative [Entamoeba invadens IP1]|eukprot:XP_004183027.1 zinc phosphodiesterase, putative [Entamoeba invadens IP1]
MDHLLLVGTGSARPVLNRCTSSTVLYTNKGKDLFMFDCGDGVTYLLAQMKVPAQRIRILFITHSHIDHVGGIVSFIHSVVFATPQQLTIVAPKGTKELAEQAFKFSREEFPKTITFIDYDDVNPTKVSYKNCDFTCVPIPHMPDVPGHAILCQLHYERKEDKTLVVTGDTTSMSPMTTYILENHIQVNVIVHECTFDDDLKDKSKQWGHSCPEIVSEEIKKFVPKKCILHHFSSRYSQSYVQRMAEKVKNTTGVETFVAKDGMIVVF